MSGSSGILTRFSVVRILNHLVLFAFRGVSTVAKFILTLYTARYLGLADLGVYGLVTAAGTLSPAILGFGLTDWVARQIILATPNDALRQIAVRLSASVAAHVVFQPLIWTANFALGSPIPIAWIWFIAPIVLLEHLSQEVHDLLVARGRIALTSTLQFIRAGLWPIVVVGLALLYPEMRTLENIFLGWLLGLVLMWSVLLGWLLLQRAPLSFRWSDFARLLKGMSVSFPLYMRDIAGTASLFIDRYLISLTLGLELTGVYVFFWSVANVVHGMINSVVVQPQAAHLIGAVARGDLTGFSEVRRKMRLEATGWTILMSLAAFGAVVVLLPFLQRPALEAHIALFCLILVANWARVTADEYGFVLLALHRDRAILIASVMGAGASALLNVALVPTFGLAGAASAFLLTGLLVLSLRIWLSRYPDLRQGAMAI